MLKSRELSVYKPGQLISFVKHGTALLGEKAAMACTVAVETVITDHYNSQLRELISLDGGKEHQDLIDTISKFRDEEMEHHDIGIEHDAEQAPAYKLLTSVIKTGCKAAIFLSERI
ncbi:5-demethoxyubiquinone hydroxylase, mitochondrial [Armadillidium nasatum]|uniref:5-demethoxyubiquinone hydroxylase, mitochondrial n=1 Tax=Armadillidium nasatum TaxID=96803 RepID=A0A5N5T6G9_9CRUS|nr:5-demethoxyubiquinone hydroxylase, mitochondrial [Armadillidium nasatum]